jgi:hypothetical protein
MYKIETIKPRIENNHKCLGGLLFLVKKIVKKAKIPLIINIK